MIELLYLASQIQCGAGEGLLNIQVDVYHQEKLVQTMNVNDKALIDAPSVDDLEFQYKVMDNNAKCSLETPTEMALDSKSTLPDFKGVYEQDSVQTLLSNSGKYEELFLVELGTTDKKSGAFDMQDVVFRVDNDPTPVIPAPTVASNIFPD